MTIFNDFENALAPLVGGNDAAGAIIGISVIFVTMFGIRIAFGPDSMRGQTGLILFLIMVGFVSAPGVDWFPLYVPLLIVLIMAFMYWMKGYF